MQRYSGFGLFKHSLSHHENWQKMWRTPTPKKVYDVVIVGAERNGTVFPGAPLDNPDGCLLGRLTAKGDRRGRIFDDFLRGVQARSVIGDGEGCIVEQQWSEVRTQGRQHII